MDLCKIVQLLAYNDIMSQKYAAHTLLVYNKKKKYTRMHKICVYLLISLAKCPDFKRYAILFACSVNCSFWLSFFFFSSLFFLVYNPNTETLQIWTYHRHSLFIYNITKHYPFYISFGKNCLKKCAQNACLYIYIFFFHFFFWDVDKC